MITVVLTVSGGKTSAYQSIWCTLNKDRVAEHLGTTEDNIEFVYLFCNTGRENNTTLDFVNYLDRTFFNGKVIWLEAVIDMRVGQGTRHRVVDYHTAHRYDEYETRADTHPFTQFMKKHGTPNQDFKSCTRELKMRPQESFMRSLGYKTGEKSRDYFTAIGYRTDEERRRPSEKNSWVERKIYPFLDIEPTDKEDVNLFWEDYDHPLVIPSYRGNCETCFKKSKNKLNMVYIEDPTLFEFNKYAEKHFGTTGPEFRKDNGYNTPRKQFRENRNTDELIAVFRPVEEVREIKHFVRDTPGGCDEECTGF